MIYEIICGYNLAGAVITRVSAMPYSRFVNEHLFRPLGMVSSYVLGSRDDANFAHGSQRHLRRRIRYMCRATSSRT